MVLSLLSQALIGPFLLLFPNGRLPSPRWRPALCLTIGGPVLSAAASAVRPGPLWNGAANPFGLEGAGQLPALLRAVGQYALLVGVLLAVASLFARLRRARGEERQQLKWVVYAAAVWIAALRGLALMPAGWQWAHDLLYVLALDAFVLALGVAILKYRLYQIDLVINRTLVYGALVAFVGGVYVSLVAGLGALVGARDEPDPGLSLLATAAVAVALQPLRERVQALANRLVYGQRVCPYDVLAGFSGRLAGALTPDEVLPRTAEAAEEVPGLLAGLVDKSLVVADRAAGGSCRSADAPERRARELKLVEDAAAWGWPREVERHRRTVAPSSSC
jgi:hypothetical protein